MKHTLALVLMVLGIVGLSSCTAINMSLEQRRAMYSGENDYVLCSRYFLKLARGNEYKYVSYSLIIKEVDKRSLDCKSFPEYSSKKDFIREWVKEYEKQI